MEGNFIQFMSFLNNQYSYYPARAYWAKSAFGLVEFELD